MVSRRRAGRSVAVAALLLLGAACGWSADADGRGSDPTPASPPPHGLSVDEGASNVWLTFESPGDGAASSPDLVNEGTAPALVSVVSVDGGAVDGARGPEDERSALALPAYDASGAAPRAVVRISGAGATDDLAPRSDDFVFGADFSLDARSQGDSKLDNGNNLVQRGLAGDLSQFKLEIDKGRPACRVRGASGQVDVKLDTDVEPDQWYRARCARDGDTLTLTLQRLTPNGVRAEETGQETGEIGRLVYPAALPMSVGGKLRSSGAIVTSATDQFNGAVDNVVLDIG